MDFSNQSHMEIQEDFLLHRGPAVPAGFTSAQPCWQRHSMQMPFSKLSHMGLSKGSRSSEKNL